MQVLDREERIKQLMQEEADNEMSGWYLSFADENSFRGGVIVKARGFIHAVTATHLMGINPGGAVKGMNIDIEVFDTIPARFLNRVMSKQELIDDFEPTMEKIQHGEAGTHSRVEDSQVVSKE